MLKKKIRLKFDNRNLDKTVAEILGVVSLAINKENGYIALLMFIYKDSNEGLIEEIVTGEGKSIIIASLSIYFALRKYKVNIITSGYTLAQRDSKNMRNCLVFSI